MKHCHKWGQKLAGCGFRVTAARENILEVFMKTDKHISAEDIYLEVHKINSEIGLTTVYRTLELLEQNGIVTKFDFGHGRARYELSEEYSKKTHHHHLICNDCGKIIDYTDFINEEKEYISKTEAGLAEKHNFIIYNHIINFYGLCSECRRS